MVVKTVRQRHAVGVADEHEVAEELARLHRGRGLRSPRLPDEVGPALRGLLQLETAGISLRSVSEGLRGATSLLSDEARDAFLHALAVRSDKPFLKDRLTEVGAQWHYNERTVRRRLAEANTVVARALVARANRAGSSPLLVIEHHLVTDFRTPQPWVTSHKRVLVETAEQVHSTERFGIPPTGDAPVVPQVQVTGADLLELRQVGHSLFEVDLVIPPGLHGREHDYSLGVVIPSRAAMLPYSVLVPLQPLRLGSVTLHFGDPPQVASTWHYDGALPVTLDDPPPERRDPGVSTVTARWESPSLGRAYGVGWIWAD